MKIIAFADKECAIGLRLAGVKTADLAGGPGLAPAVLQAAADREVGIILIGEALAAQIRDTIDDFKSRHDLPLILEIPERSGSIRDRHCLERLVGEAVGQKFQ